MRDEKRIQQLMADNGFTLKRKNKHPIFTDGLSTITASLTTSDWRGHKNLEAEVKRAVRRRETSLISAAPPPPEKKETYWQTRNRLIDAMNRGDMRTLLEIEAEDPQAYHGLVRQAKNAGAGANMAVELLESAVLPKNPSPAPIQQSSELSHPEKPEKQEPPMQQKKPSHAVPGPFGPKLSEKRRAEIDEQIVSLYGEAHLNLSETSDALAEGGFLSISGRKIGPSEVLLRVKILAKKNRLVWRPRGKEPPVTKNKTAKVKSSSVEKLAIFTDTERTVLDHKVLTPDQKVRMLLVAASSNVMALAILTDPHLSTLQKLDMLAVMAEIGQKK